jgi:hypothetical protein
MTNAQSPESDRLGENDYSEVCMNCGKHISVTEQAYVFKEQIVCHDCDTKLRSTENNLDVCFFCKNNQSDRDSCHEQVMSKVFEKGSDVFGLIHNGQFDQASHDVVLSREDALKQISASYVVRNENVPRCKECRSRHKRYDLFKSLLFGFFIFCGLIAGLFIGIRLILRAGDYRFNTVMAGIILTFGFIFLGIIAGALIGLIAHFLFMIIAPYSTLKGTQSIKKINVFPRIKQLIDNGWRLRVAPPLAQGLSSMKMPKIGNETIFKQVAEKIGLDYMPQSLHLITSIKDKGRDKQTTDFNRFGPIGGFLIFMIGLVVVFYVRSGFRQLFEGLERKETIEFRQRIQEIMPADPNYNFQGKVERNYLDPVNGFFEVHVPKTVSIKPDTIHKTMKLPPESKHVGKSVSCSNITISFPNWDVIIQARESLNEEISIREQGRRARQISKYMRLSQEQPIFIDGVKGAEVLGEALGDLYHFVKYQKDGLNHLIVFRCKWKYSSSAQREFIDFLRFYKSSSLDESSNDGNKDDDIETNL